MVGVIDGHKEIASLTPVTTWPYEPLDYYDFRNSMSPGDGKAGQ